MRRIRTRMMIAFLVVVLLPAIPLSIVVRDLLERSFSPPLGGAVESALEASLTESRETLRLRKEDFRRRVAHEWSRRIAAAESAGIPEQGDAATLAEGETLVRHTASREESGAGPEKTLARNGSVPYEEKSLLRWAGRVPPGDPGAILGGPERVDRFLAVVVGGPAGGTFLLAEALPADLVGRAEKVTDALGLLRGMRRERGAILRSYVVPFVLAYALLILVALGAGALLARRIARPVEALVDNTKRIAAGDLDARVTTREPGEVGELILSFNQMVGRLAEQRRELARLNRIAAWRDLARSLAHEVKNPLTPILLAVQEMRDSYKERDRRYRALLDECTEVVREEVESLRNLVREFSEFARLPEPKLEWGDLRGLLEEIARLYGPERVDYTPSPVALHARFDPAEMKRALINLVENGLAACAAAGRPERVAITAAQAGGALAIVVGDRGCGIAPENLERIFEPDFSTKKEGMGLGLPIVEGIVKGHGGTLGVRSKPGEGTTFTIRLRIENGTEESDEP